MNKLVYIWFNLANKDFRVTNWSKMSFQFMSMGIIFRNKNNQGLV